LYPIGGFFNYCAAIDQNKSGLNAKGLKKTANFLLMPEGIISVLVLNPYQVEKKEFSKK
jgi:hypothetical protein